MRITRGLAAGLGLLLLSGCGSSSSLADSSYTDAGHGIHWKYTSDTVSCGSGQSCTDIEVITDSDCDKLSVTVFAFDYNGEMIGMSIAFNGNIKAGEPREMTLTTTSAVSIGPSDFTCS